MEKGDGAEQHEVWNGAKLSVLALRPPKPPFLACPAALTGLEADDGRRVFASVRGGKSFFDQLRLPAQLSLAMCRPAVTVKELLSWAAPGHSRMTEEELGEYVVDDRGLDHLRPYYPASLVFPWDFLGRLSSRSRPCFAH